MTVEYLIGDVFDRLAEIPDESVDLVVTSPPFLALRSYLPDDHPAKGREVGSESTPAAYLDRLLTLTAELGRVLAPHGSICVELGDTYSGSGGSGGDYNAGGLRDGQPGFDGTARRMRPVKFAPDTNPDPAFRRDNKGTGFVAMSGGRGWPLAKSLTGIPTLYAWSLAYGRNLLTGEVTATGCWRIRNVIVWGRPNPPVGALGDKFRPATSYITVACKGTKRYFDLDAVRKDPDDTYFTHSLNSTTRAGSGRADDGQQFYSNGNPAGAPPLDWWTDDHPEDGDWLWKLATRPYRGAHFATFPLTLPIRLIRAMCPWHVCVECGVPSRRLTDTTRRLTDGTIATTDFMAGNRGSGINQQNATIRNWSHTDRATTGWTDCGHDAWRIGVVLDPFVGSGTTLEAAQIVGRDAIGIDADERNIDLAKSRVGMFLETPDEEPPPVIRDQLSIYDVLDDAQ